MPQEILDGSVLLKTTFVKKAFPSSGYGGDWAVRISVEDIRFVPGPITNPYISAGNIFHFLMELLCEYIMSDFIP